MIRNVSDFPVGAAVLQLQFFDSSDNVLFDSSFVEASSGLLPGEELPFRMMTLQQLPTMDRYDLTVVQLSPFAKDGIPVTTHGVNMVLRENDLIQVVGEIENPSELPVFIDRLVVSLQGSTGELLSVEACDICAEYLKPGERGPFRVQFYDSRNAVDYTVYISAVPTIDIDDLQIDILNDTRIFIDSMNWLHLIGEAINNGDDRYMISLLATLFDEQGNVLDASAARILPAALLPSESGYFDLKFGGPSTGALDASQVSDWDIQVDRMQTGPIDETEELVTLNTSYEAQYPSAGRAVIEGLVVNNDDQTLRAVYVTVLLSEGQSGQVIGIGESVDTVTLSSGDELAYSVIVDFDVQVPETGVHVTVNAMGVISD